MTGEVRPVPRDALVSVVVPVRGERIRFHGVLLGRLTRSGGKAVAAEVELEDGRVTLVPARDVDAVNDAARIMMADAGPSARADV